MRTHELWYVRPNPPLLLGWLILPVGAFLTVFALMYPIAIFGDVLAGVVAMGYVYCMTGWVVLKYLLPRTIDWPDLPTNMIVGARLGVMLAWPTRWTSIMITVTWNYMLG